MPTIFYLLLKNFSFWQYFRFENKISFDTFCKTQATKKGGNLNENRPSQKSRAQLCLNTRILSFQNNIHVSYFTSF